MEILVNEERQLVEIWLRQDEQELREQLKPHFTQWRKQGLFPVVFLSGDKELACRTSDLLCHNRKRLAELETRKEKSRRAAM